MQSHDFLLNEDLIKNIAASATQKAAVACMPWIGRLDEKAADQAAVNAMRLFLNSSKISGKVVIGEGERDNAPMLYSGELLGKSGIEVDIAVDPLEGTTICAEGGVGALSVIALAPRGSLLEAPDLYMEKIAVGIDCDVDLDNTPEENLHNLAAAKGCDISDLCVVILKRERHIQLIESVRKLGVRIKLISDGDIAAVIYTALCMESGVDMYIGTGGAPEGVLAAAALKCLGGKMQGRLLDDKKVKLDINDMVKSRVVLSMTGVTCGNILKGVSRFSKGNRDFVSYETLVFAEKSFVKSETHHFDAKL